MLDQGGSAQSGSKVVARELVSTRQASAYFRANAVIQEILTIELSGATSSMSGGVLCCEALDFRPLFLRS